MKHSNYNAATHFDGDPLQRMLKLQGESGKAAHAEAIEQGREQPRLFAVYREGSRWRFAMERFYMEEKCAGRFKSRRFSLLRRVLGLRPS